VPNSLGRPDSGSKLCTDFKVVRANGDTKLLFQLQLLGAGGWAPIEALHQCRSLHEQLQLGKRVAGTGTAASAHGDEFEKLAVIGGVSSSQLYLPLHCQKSIGIKHIRPLPQSVVARHSELVDKHLV